MKILIAASLILISTQSVLADALPKSEGEFISHAISEGYQAQRNLAFYYQTGSGNFGGKDSIAKDDVKSCAWRKILLFANPEKTDSSDISNERSSCQNLNFKQDEAVWQMVYQYIPQIDALKAKGNYMVEKDSSPSGELGIIDLQP